IYLDFEDLQLLQLKVLGGVLHILHNNPCHLEVCVDSWPTFSTAICYRQKQVYSMVIPDICTAFTKNPQTLRRLLVNERVVNWSHGLTFRGTSLVYSVIGVVYLYSCRVAPCSIFWQYNKDFILLVITNMKVLPLPVSILDESHAELVDRHLPYGGSQQSLNHVKACVRHLPNHCVTDETGRPVSWMLSDELCELRMAYTLPEHRRAGHLLVLSLTLIQRMRSLGLPVYCHVNQQNQATIKAVTALGFSACSDTETMSVLLICKDRE
uniref:Glycine N-acyltransferase-like protein n=1 Tax=Sphaeramia orbicularis TaxID=375764 RepID=A0A672YWT9_9TELE